MNRSLSFTTLLLVAAGCSAGRNQPDTAVAVQPPAAAATTSPRHGEWVMVRTPQGDSVRTWVVFPERPTRAPVVLVVHEIYGLTPWIRGVADQLAAAGFIAAAPDLLTAHNIPGSPDDPDRQAATTAIRSLNPDDVHRQLRAVAAQMMQHPAALPRYGIVGFCWGGGVSFEHAVRVPDLGASVVYYGTSPAPARLATVRAPVLGLYGGNDARVNATVPPADSALRTLGRTFRVVTYEGAGHGFLRQLDGQEGANRRAADAAWPETINWFRRYLEEG